MKRKLKESLLNSLKQAVNQMASFINYNQIL